MGFLFLLAVGVLVIYLSNKSSATNRQLSDELRQRNQQWVGFIAGYRKLAKSKAEQALLDRMLEDISRQGLAPSARSLNDEPQVLEPAAVDQHYEPAEALVMAADMTSAEAVQRPAPVQLDNASLLLYFGAFLFVASVGLFVAFGDTSGAVRTIAVLLVTLALYTTGLWLFREKTKLRQAGIAFAGIGMAIAPLVGVAAYYYLFDQTQGPAIWLLTSLLCLVMYAHALTVLRHPLISYILIFTFLSLFESGVSIIEAPVYYFGWGMALVGIILSLLNRWKGYWPEVRESSRASAQLFLPLSLAVSAIMLPTQGAVQLGISLLFAAAFYGLEALNSQGSEQETTAAVAQAAALLGISSISYGITESWTTVALTVTGLNLLQMVFLVSRRASPLMLNFATVMLASGVLGIVTGLQSPAALVASVATLWLAGLVIWLRQQRIDAFIIGAISWMALPLVVGQVWLEPRLTPGGQTALVYFALVGLAMLYWLRHGRQNVTSWVQTVQQLILAGAALVIVTSYFASVWVCLAVGFGVAALLLLLTQLDKDADWAVVAGVAVAAPLFNTASDAQAFLATLLPAILLNIYIALRYRRELTRWFGTLLWMLLPLAVSANSSNWTPAHYAWAYMVCFAGLVLARAIARGVVFASSKVPLASYARTASNAYMFGYIAAAIMACSFASVSDDARLHTTLILAVLSGAIVLISRVIEKRADILFLLPFALQAVLFSAIRPSVDILEPYLVSSIALAAAMYVLLPARVGKEDTSARDGGLATALIAPLSLFFASTTLWPMPLGLAVFGVLLYDRLHDTNQNNREWVGGVLLLSFMWYLHFLGVRNPQAYSHLLALLFAGYAYWRHLRSERDQSDQYLLWMLGTATVPLALQAISGESGGIYGWWLLLEQVGFMLLGMAINRRKVVFWGLYVAIAAVLYQLRNLGWAALTVLATFLIGLAIYYLQKHSDEPPQN